MRDNTCTFWPDGWPWNPTQWLHCCLDHDAGGTDLALGLCVAATGWLPEIMMGLVVGFGVSLFKHPYRIVKRWLPSKP